MTRCGSVEILSDSAGTFGRGVQDDTATRRALKRRAFSIRSGLGRFGFFDEGFLADDDDDTGIADVEAAAVGFEVVADFGALGKADVAVDDGAANARVAADIHVIVDDGV